ncbi:MAG: hypothetical protein PHQ47_01320 [Candidatus Portnoybacteria bacterium]|nr:hypothetical protein [Candidatus Portnoybacteria bacterium]
MKGKKAKNPERQKENKKKKTDPNQTAPGCENQKLVGAFGFFLCGRNSGKTAKKDL